MSILREYYNTGADSAKDIYQNFWRGQSFTPITSFPLEKIKLNLCRNGDVDSDLIISVRLSDINGKPTGQDLVTKTIDGMSLPVYSMPPFDNIPKFEIIFNSNPNLSKNTKYIIQCKSTGVVEANVISWTIDVSSPTYNRGNSCRSEDGGITWILESYDYMFEVYSLGEWVTIKNEPEIVKDFLIDKGIDYALSDLVNTENIITKRPEYKHEYPYIYIRKSDANQDQMVGNSAMQPSYHSPVYIMMEISTIKNLVRTYNGIGYRDGKLAELISDIVKQLFFDYKKYVSPNYPTAPFITARFVTDTNPTGAIAIGNAYQVNLSFELLFEVRTNEI